MNPVRPRLDAPQYGGAGLVKCRDVNQPEASNGVRPCSIMKSLIFNGARKTAIEKAYLKNQIKGGLTG